MKEDGGIASVKNQVKSCKGEGLRGNQLRRAENSRLELIKNVKKRE